MENRAAGKDKRRKVEARRKKMMSRRIGMIFGMIYAVITLLFISQLVNLNMLSLKFMIPLVVVMILLAFFLYSIQFGRRVSRGKKLVGRSVIILLSGVLGTGMFVVSKTSAGLNRIANGKNTTTISVVSLKDGNYAKLNTMDKAQIARSETGSQTDVVRAIADIEAEIGADIEPEIYEKITDLTADLYSGKIDAIILNEGMRRLYLDAAPDFEEKTSVVWSQDYEKDITESTKDVAVTKEAFSVYISGIDTYGEVDTEGHSDVNMIVTVNPKTHQVLMTSIPRDYYIPQSCQGGQNDKLTHTGIWGVDYTEEAVSDYFGVDINYYLKVNLSGVTNIITAIGDIEVDNPYEFTGGEGNFHFAKGKIKLNADQALSYARERQSFAASDEMRIQNQSRVLEGVIKKVTSPSIITRYAGLIDALATSFQTNMPREDMNALVKMQLDKMPSWTITQVSANGNADEEGYSPASGTVVSIMMPNSQSVKDVRNIIELVLEGKDITKALDAYKNDNQVSDEVLDPNFYESRTDLGEVTTVPSTE